jgi:hypothetical protein
MGVSEMDNDYLSDFQKVDLPSDEQTLAFVHRFSLEHSWYKHLNWNQPTDFVFYVDPENGQWCYYSPRLNKTYSIEEDECNDESDPIPFVPLEIKVRGTYGLTGLIHGYFRTHESDLQKKYEQQKSGLIEFLFELRDELKRLINQL